MQHVAGNLAPPINRNTHARASIAFGARVIMRSRHVDMIDATSTMLEIHSNGLKILMQ